MALLPNLTDLFNQNVQILDAINAHEAASATRHTALLAAIAALNATAQVRHLAILNAITAATADGSQYDAMMRHRLWCATHLGVV